MILRPDELGGLYTCADHPTFQGTEVDAAVHLRTLHNPLWVALAAMQVTPLTAPPKAEATAPATFSPPHRRTPKGSRRTARYKRA